jgi:hypothetical protein
MAVAAIGLTATAPATMWKGSVMAMVFEKSVGDALIMDGGTVEIPL